MYYEKTGTAAKARTTTLNEELGKRQTKLALHVIDTRSFIARQ